MEGLLFLLQEQGKRYGPSARLYNKVEYIWLASSGELTQQSAYSALIDHVFAWNVDQRFALYVSIVVA
ncbi:hypothetical protein [Enterobacter ludwigii]|uniref:hypothetical protein n=1 Tax=Enterobacter ludwigii TaxID=299767 RepID=UPI00307680CC